MGRAPSRPGRGHVAVLPPQLHREPDPDLDPRSEVVEATLGSWASVADIGCGCGASTIIALAYPASRFVGFDYHEGSIVKARKAAAEAGVADRCRFDVATAKDYEDGAYDLVTVFDALHDMGDPTGAAADVLDTLAPDGTWMIVEPFAEDRLEDNLNVVGRIFYSDRPRSASRSRAPKGRRRTGSPGG